MPTIFTLVEFEMINGKIIGVKAQKVVCNSIIQNFTVRFDNLQFQKGVNEFLNFIGMKPVLLKNELHKTMPELNRICLEAGADLIPNTVIEVLEILWTESLEITLA